MLLSTDYVKAAWNSYYENYKWPKLFELANWCGVQFDASMMHDASYDLSILEQCFFSKKYQECILGNSFFEELNTVNSKPIKIDSSNHKNNNDDFDDDIPF
jgi:hypothetical protein